MSEDPLHVLVVEPQFPGRLGSVADWLVRRRGYRVHFLCHRLEPAAFWPSSIGHGLEVIQYQVGGIAKEPTAQWTRSLERGLCYAYGAWEVLESRRIRPVDLAIGHSAGLGSSLFVPGVYPGIPIVQYCHYYIHPKDNDLYGEDRESLPVEYVHWRRAANAMELLDLENGVVPWTATNWQRDLYPTEYRDRFRVLHPGVESSRQRRVSRQVLGRTLEAGDRLVTFVARRLDRVRGFDRFVALARRLIAERSNVVCAVVGEGRVDRMLDIPNHGQDYAARLLAGSAQLDPSRLWMLGSIAAADLTELLGASHLHIVPSRPYPVSRSHLEAMGAGCVVMAWDTQPVREVIIEGETGLLTSEQDADASVKQALEVIDDPGAFAPLGRAASELVQERYDSEVTAPRLARMLSRLVQSTGSGSGVDSSENTSGEGGRWRGDRLCEEPLVASPPTRQPGPTVAGKDERFQP